MCFSFYMPKNPETALFGLQRRTQEAFLAEGSVFEEAATEPRWVVI
jgi:hypothetical protein